MAYEELPYVFTMARMKYNKTCLTYDEYMRFLEDWRGMSEDEKKYYQTLK